MKMPLTELVESWINGNLEAVVSELEVSSRSDVVEFVTLLISEFGHDGDAIALNLARLSEMLKG